MTVTFICVATRELTKIELLSDELEIAFVKTVFSAISKNERKIDINLTSNCYIVTYQNFIE